MRTSLLLTVALVFAVGYAASETPCHELAPKFSMYLDMTSGMYDKAMTGNGQKTKYCNAVAEILAALDEEGGGSDPTITAGGGGAGGAAPALSPSNCDSTTPDQCNKDPSCEWHEVSAACKPKCESIGADKVLCLATEVDQSNTEEAAKHSSCFYCDGHCKATRGENCKNTEMFDSDANEKGVAEKKQRLDTEITQLVNSLKALSICSDEQNHLVANAEKFKNTSNDAKKHLMSVQAEVERLEEESDEREDEYQQYTAFLSGNGDDPVSTGLVTLNNRAEAKLKGMEDTFAPFGDIFETQMSKLLHGMIVEIDETIEHMSAENQKMVTLYALVTKPDVDTMRLAKLNHSKDPKNLEQAKPKAQRVVEDITPIEDSLCVSRNIRLTSKALKDNVFGEKALKRNTATKHAISAWCLCAQKMQDKEECDEATYEIVEGKPTKAQVDAFMVHFTKAVKEKSTGGLEGAFLPAAL